MAELDPDVLDEELVDPSESEDAEVPTAVRYTISSYGADYPVDGLVKRLDRGDLYVPEFQRGFVWSPAQASRFVESLLLGLPVPGIFLFKEPDTNKLVVVDGQQRLRTVEAFCGGVLRGKEFKLRGVSDSLDGKTYKTLSDEDRRRLDDSIIHATVFQQDDPDDDRSSIYMIFERLNTGGTPLTAQEIRSCVYRGSFNKLLRRLAEDERWLKIYGKPSARCRDQELILRFLALTEAATGYERPMKVFLNDFMSKYRVADEAAVGRLAQAFVSTIAAASHLTPKTFRPERNLNVAVTEAILVGIHRRLEAGEIQQPDGLQSIADSLIKNEDFLASVTSATTEPSSVATRVRLATEAFKRAE